MHFSPPASDVIAAQNQVTWNRWMAPRIPDDLKAALLEKGHTQEELTPFAEDELPTIDGISPDAEIDFSHTEFGALCAYKFVFPDAVSFAGATYNGIADFSSAEFSGSSDFSSATFSGSSDFSSATFNGVVDFSSATFSRSAFFSSATFSGSSIPNIFSRAAIFRGATFRGYADFRSATLGIDCTSLVGERRVSHVDFSSATFSDHAVFSNATFRGHAIFRRTTFSAYAYFDATFSHADFSSATFRGSTDLINETRIPNIFSRAIFSGSASFRNAAFYSHTDFINATFINATFSDDADFSRATFRGEANFANAKMKGRTVFDEAEFSQPPQFSDAEMHQATTWFGAKWPDTPPDIEQAKSFIVSYEALKLEMDRLKKHGDELDFFARELQSRRFLLGFWKGLPIAIYGFVSDYGRSYMRPLLLR